MEVYPMTPHFETMTKEELKAYVLANKSDKEAFYKLADRLKADNQDSPWYPYPATPETVSLMEQAIQDKLDNQLR
jgi:hypothetical protein